jgi:16S rRNA processing protein RimM
VLLVGRVDKPHGLRGEVVVSLITNRDERVAVGSRLRLDGPDGPEVVVLHSKPMSHRWLVAFDGVFDRDTAEEVAHRDLYAEPIDDEDALWIHEMIGKVVVDQHGVTRGEVTAVEANPASDLLVLDTGALVPLTFVVGSDDVIRVDVPDGLFE